jgi:hypothetical protein
VSKQLANLRERVGGAVSYFWTARQRQSEKQKGLGRSDQGSRAAVTGGYQMLRFSELITNLLKEAGVTAEHIFITKALELPGFFRPTKEWDLLVV